MAVDVLDAEVGNSLRAVVERLVELGVDYRNAVLEWRREWLLAELKQAKGNQCTAARRMGVHRNTVGGLQVSSGLCINPAGIDLNNPLVASAYHLWQAIEASGGDYQKLTEAAHKARAHLDEVAAYFAAQGSAKDRT